MSTPSASLASAADHPELWALRHQVFVVEQAVPPELEQDELDDVAAHAVVRDAAGRVVGTGRVVVEGGDHERVARIGRMAVAGDARRAGVGAALLALLEGEARLAGCTRVELHAQSHAEGFYRSAGYEPDGDPFDEAGIPHVAMWKPLS